MIINKFSIFTKGQTLGLKIINIFRLIFIISVILLLVISVKNTQNINIWYIFIGIASIASLIEITIKNTANKKFFLFTLLLKSFRYTGKILEPTSMQTEICLWINTKLKNRESIFIYGDINYGKTISVFTYLSQYIKNEKILEDLNWLKHAVYIDCKNNKNDILDFFNLEFKDIKHKQNYETFLVIVDNIEAMGQIFVNQLLSTIQSSLCPFIIIADIIEMDIIPFRGISEISINKIEKSLYIKSNDNVVEKFTRNYNILTYDAKVVLLLIYYLSMSTTLVSTDNLIKLLRNDNVCYKRKKFKSIIKHLCHYKFIKKFPFNPDYVLLINRQLIIHNQEYFWQTEENFSAIMSIVDHSKDFPESAWLAFIHLSYNKLCVINSKKSEERKILFQSAITCGNYYTLFQALENELVFCPLKEKLFLYELGTLSFHTGNQKKAFENYNRMLKEISDNDYKMVLMLKIIETTHGDVNELTRKNIDNYLSKLKQFGEPYSLFAQYWELHINTERGKFDLPAYTQLLSKILELKNSNDFSEIKLELTKRTYTDIIRCNHIVYISPTDKFINSFLTFMKNEFANSIYTYYDALYAKASLLHYITLMDNLLSGKDCKQIYFDANLQYCKAISIGYQNVKSVSACELKYIDLQLFDPNNSKHFSDYETKINKFMSNAEINNVSVHVAYSKTLLAKLYMVRNLLDEELYLSSEKQQKAMKDIYLLLEEAEKIYKNYNNNYGIIRIHFMKSIYKIAFNQSVEDVNSIIKNMTAVLKSYDDYGREHTIISAIAAMNSVEGCSPMFISSIIKAYPIILQ